MDIINQLLSLKEYLLKLDIDNTEDIRAIENAILIIKRYNAIKELLR